MKLKVGEWGGFVLLGFCKKVSNSAFDCNPMQPIKEGGVWVFNKPTGI